MRLERSKNSLRNIIFGTLYQIVNILMPFLVRTAFIYSLGAQYLGLNSLFSSILTVLNLSELGFSSAVVFSMYKPIANGDYKAINALLLYYKKIYRVIGIIVLSVGVALIPILPYLVSGEYPDDINLTYVYLGFLLNTSLSYFLFAYYSSIIYAHQRQDLISKISIVLSIIKHIIQIIVVVYYHNYYLYLLILIISTIVDNIVTYSVAKKHFPQFRAEGKLSNNTKSELKTKVSGLMINKICQVSRNSFDSIITSAFLGLTITAIYNNYYYIMNAVVGFAMIISTSILAGAGNSIALESQGKNFNDMRKLLFIFMWFAGWSTVCLLCLYQPFMKIWVGEELMFPDGIVYLTCVYYYTLLMGVIRGMYSDACGLWWENRYRAILESVVNLLLNILLGKLFGIYGIILATLVSLFFINFVYGSSLLFKYYFTEQKSIIYYKDHAVYFVVTALVASITYFTCSMVHLDGLVNIIIRLIICIIIPNFLYFILYRNISIFRESVEWIKTRFFCHGMKKRGNTVS